MDGFRDETSKNVPRDQSGRLRPSGPGRGRSHPGKTVRVGKKGSDNGSCTAGCVASDRRPAGDRPSPVDDLLPSAGRQQDQGFSQGHGFEEGQPAGLGDHHIGGCHPVGHVVDEPHRPDSEPATLMGPGPTMAGLEKRRILSGNGNEGQLPGKAGEGVEGGRKVPDSLATGQDKDGSSVRKSEPP